MLLVWSAAQQLIQPERELDEEGCEATDAYAAILKRPSINFACSFASLLSNLFTCPFLIIFTVSPA